MTVKIDGNGAQAFAIPVVAIRDSVAFLSRLLFTYRHAQLPQNSKLKLHGVTNSTVPLNDKMHPFLNAEVKASDPSQINWTRAKARQRFAPAKEIEIRFSEPPSGQDQHKRQTVTWTAAFRVVVSAEAVSWLSERGLTPHAANS